MAARIEVRRAADRFVTALDWLDSRHSFSFGPHYDPGNTHHGLLVSHNEDVLAPGAGFDTHRHAGMEVVTWVLAGALTHRDGTGGTATVRPGHIAVMSSGTGIEHSERNERNDAEPDASQPRTHYLQMWIIAETADESLGPPAHAVRDVRPALAAGTLVPVASGRPQHVGAGAVALRNPAAALQVARLAPHGPLLLPDAAYLHVFIARGGARFAGRLLGAGDAVRCSGAPSTQLSAGPDGVEILVWEMDRALGG